jgi:hypothetical protein
MSTQHSHGRAKSSLAVKVGLTLIDRPAFCRCHGVTPRSCSFRDLDADMFMSGYTGRLIGENVERDIKAGLNNLTVLKVRRIMD